MEKFQPVGSLRPEHEHMPVIRIFADDIGDQRRQRIDPGAKVDRTRHQQDLEVSLITDHPL